MGFSKSKVLFMFLILALAMVAADEACSISKSSISGRCTVEDQTETSYRLLAGKRKAINYEALRKNAVNCNQPGQSYYNCHRGGPINPYTRSCSVITCCRRIY
ncbi:hypothetical protein V6N13_023467 [Hibiscus sabdariffa]|uniref:Uncharacterized protein n=2 Tax=Hibiscus sabdariffa TaxID=183260 RepID=A0ABR2A8F8_9ROSI